MTESKATENTHVTQESLPLLSNVTPSAPIDIKENVPVIKETKNDNKNGEYMGQCKWFNDRLGFGFITISSSDKKGSDIFVHFSAINSANSQYKTLRKGEYVQFDIEKSQSDGHEIQAVNVTGILGGPLMCDCLTTATKRSGFMVLPPPPPSYLNNDKGHFNNFPNYRNNSYENGNNNRNVEEWKTINKKVFVANNGRNYKNAVKTQQNNKIKTSINEIN
jgi:cold shock CspA family protein